MREIDTVFADPFQSRKLWGNIYSSQIRGKEKIGEKGGNLEKGEGEEVGGGEKEEIVDNYNYNGNNNDNVNDNKGENGEKNTSHNNLINNKKNIECKEEETFKIQNVENPILVNHSNQPEFFIHDGGNLDINTPTSQPNFNLNINGSSNSKKLQ